MKQTFKLDGLDCAHCAAKMQEGISKLDGVTSATVNFVTTKLTIQAEEEKLPGIIDAVKALIHKLEPDVVMKKV